MAQQLSSSESARTIRRARASRSRRLVRERDNASVVVAWSASDVENGRYLAPVELELQAAPAGEAWICKELSGASWVDAISAARCTEVMLTARLGDDGSAKHLVLELAELLTQKLSATKPHIRVRFLPLTP